MSTPNPKVQELLAQRAAAKAAAAAAAAAAGGGANPAGVPPSTSTFTPASTYTPSASTYTPSAASTYTPSASTYTPSAASNYTPSAASTASTYTPAAASTFTPAARPQRPPAATSQEREKEKEKEKEKEREKKEKREKEKEIYETPDVDESETQQQQNPRQIANVNISNFQTGPTPIAVVEKFDKQVYATAPPTALPSRNEYIIRGGKEKKFESPAETYQRLKYEVSRFKDDLESMSTDLKKSGDSIELSSFPPELFAELKTLQQELSTIATDQRFGGFLQSADLASVLQIPEEAKTANGGAITTTSANGLNTVGEGGLMYELFFSPEIREDGGDIDQQLILAQLNQKVTSLETVVGSNNPPIPKDLKTLLIELNKKAELLDVSHLELVNIKLHTLSQKIEEQKKLPQKTPQQERKIDTLYDSVSKVEVIISEVPLIVARLQSLQRVHEAGASFIDEFQKLQSQQNAILSLLSNQSSSLKQVEEGMNTNFLTLSENFQILQKRMGGLEKKLEQLGK